MADETKETVVETPTAMAGELKAKTDAAHKAVAGGGFDDPEFDKALQAAIDKDMGRTPAEPADEPEPDKAKQESAKTDNKDKKPDLIPDDIPSELLGDKKQEPKPDDAAARAAEAERQKYIDDQTKGMTPKAAERFKKIESRAYEAEQRAKKISEERESEKSALQKEIQNLAIKAASRTEEPAEVEKLKKQIEELEEVVTKASLQDNPKFKAAYDGKITSEIDKVKKVIPSEHAEEVGELLALPISKKRNERIEEIADSLDAIARQKLIGALERVDYTATEKAEQLSKWKENKVHLDADNLRKQQVSEEKLKEIQQVAWNTGMAMVASPETGLEVFRKASGNDDWNAKVDARMVAVQRILNQPEMKPEKLVEIAARAVAADDYRNMFLAQRLLVKRLNEELSELKKAEPEPKDDKGAATHPGPDNRSFIDAVVEETLKVGGLQR